MVTMNMLLIFAFPDKNMLIWMYKCLYYILIITMLTYLKIFYAHMDRGGIFYLTDLGSFSFFGNVLFLPLDVKKSSIKVLIILTLE